MRHGPHVTLSVRHVVRFEPVRVLRYRVVGEVREDAEVAQREVLRTEAEVAFVVEMHGEGVPIGDEHPLPDVELAVADDEGALDVLLGDEALFGGDALELAVLSDVRERIEAADATPAGFPRRFHDPDVVHSVEVPLRGPHPELLNHVSAALQLGAREHLALAQRARLRLAARGRRMVRRRTVREAHGRRLRARGRRRRFHREAEALSVQQRGPLRVRQPRNGRTVAREILLH